MRQSQRTGVSPAPRKLTDATAALQQLGYEVMRSLTVLAGMVVHRHAFLRQCERAADGAHDELLPGSTVAAASEIVYVQDDEPVGVSTAHLHRKS